MSGLQNSASICEHRFRGNWAQEQHGRSAWTAAQRALPLCPASRGIKFW